MMRVKQIAKRQSFRLNRRSPPGDWHMTQSDDSNRLIDAGNQERGDNALRPTSLVDFIGQGNGRAI